MLYYQVNSVSLRITNSMPISNVVYFFSGLGDASERTLLCTHFNQFIIFICHVNQSDNHSRYSTLPLY